jgi:hypothetical protein
VTAKLNSSAEQLLALRKGIIAELWEHPRYKHLIEELRARRPSIPYWKPAHVNMKGVLIPDNTADLQAASAAQKWHDVLLAIIDPERYPRGGE